MFHWSEFSYLALFNLLIIIIILFLSDILCLSEQFIYCCHFHRANHYREQFKLIDSLEEFNIFFYLARMY